MRIRYVYGKMIKKTGGNYDMYSGKNMNFCGISINETANERICYGEPDDLPSQENHFIEKGWWSIDKSGEHPITRAVPGMNVYFHIKTNNIPDGDKVLIGFYEYDNSEKEESGKEGKDKDGHKVLSTGYYKVRNGKIVLLKPLNNLDSFINKNNDIDKLIKLYSICTYNNSVKLPSNNDDDLVVGSLVIDRYKMPGINKEGSDIADDLTYGKGKPNPIPIYDEKQVKKYKDEYKNSGFDKEKHGLFTNKEDLPSRGTKDGDTLMAGSLELSKEDLWKDFKDLKSLLANIPSRRTKDKYSLDQIKELGDGLMELSLTKFTEKLLWKQFKDLKSILVWGDLSDVLDKMIEKFKGNKGGVFENDKLTKSIKDNTSTRNYCRYVENYIAEKIKQETLKNVIGIEDKEPDFGTTDENINKKRIDKDKIKGKDIISDEYNTPVAFTRPSFSFRNDNNLFSGRTLALNDIWATEVILKELKNEGEDYTIKYQVTMWDHFGLDLPDMEKFYVIDPGFRAWFLLQHYYGYKPFVTKITFEKEFTGNINKGREERLKRQ